MRGSKSSIQAAPRADLEPQPALRGPKCDLKSAALASALVMPVHTAGIAGLAATHCLAQPSAGHDGLDPRWNWLQQCRSRQPYFNHAHSNCTRTQRNGILEECLGNY